MFRTKRISSIINLCFILYLIVFAIIIMVQSLSDGNLSFDKNETANVFQIAFVFSITFIISIFQACFYNILVIILFIGIKLGLRSAKKDKLSDVDFGKYKNYYRDIIQDYSPATLSYIDDFEVNEKDVIATLLSLKQKGYIKIEDKKVKIINNNYDNLKSTEKYLINNINNFNMPGFNTSVIAEAKVSGLLETQDDFKKEMRQKIIILIVSFLILVLLSFISFQLMELNNNSLLSIFCFIVFLFTIFIGFFYPLFSIIYLKTYMFNNVWINPYVRTKKGNEINEMLEGLKNYIKDFSILDERSAKELMLWDEYLIYSVIFNQNDKIIREFEDIKLFNN